MLSAFVEYFRCPDEFVGFTSPDRSKGAPGFFRFGSATCFGRCEAATLQPIRTDQLLDSRELIACADNLVQLPFDPEEVFENLRTERYISSDSSFSSSMIRRAYYALRSV